jgi:hypothetical protein
MSGAFIAANWKSVAVHVSTAEEDEIGASCMLDRLWVCECQDN